MHQKVKKKQNQKFKKNKFLQQEKLGRTIDKEEEKYQNKQKEMIVEKSKEKYFYQQVPVKVFVNKMRFFLIFYKKENFK